MQAPAPKMTLDAYRAWSLTAELKHEFVNGEVVAMSGGTPRHAAIAGNVYYAVQLRLDGQPCRPTNSDQRLFVEETEACFYPDLQVICGPYALAADGLSVTNPTLVVEVLSPSTRDHDQGAKWAHYRRVPSLQAYLMVDPDARAAVLYTRNASGWQLTEHASGEIPLPSIGVSLPLDALFANLDAIPG